MKQEQVLGGFEEFVVELAAVQESIITQVAVDLGVDQ